MQDTPQEKPVDSKGGGRGKDTLFRVAARNQIELIAIADNKANMIIGICVVLISLMIALLGSGYVFQGRAIASLPELVIPLGILLFFSLLAAVSAILAAKPQIIKGKEQTVHSLLFFRNIHEKTPQQYLDAMHALLKERKKVYDQIIIDMYNNGVILHRKYRQLNTAYLLFMIGLVLAVLAFAVTMLVR